jgi:hypothetical protein
MSIPSVPPLAVSAKLHIPYLALIRTSADILPLLEYIEYPHIDLLNTLSPSQRHIQALMPALIREVSTLYLELHRQDKCRD